MNQLARRFTQKCWSMAWKQELCFLQYLPNIPAYLPLPRYFQRYFHSSTLSPRVSAVVEHSIICRFQESGTIWVTLGVGSPLKLKDVCSGEVCSTFFPLHWSLSVCHISTWLLIPARHTQWHRGILAVEKKKLQKLFTEHWSMPKYTRH